MAAPTHTVRPTQAGLQAAGGVQLPNGFSSILIFARLPLAIFYTMTLKPGAIDGGEPIDQTTMLNPAPGPHNFAARALWIEGPSTVEAAYDPNLRAQIRATLINQNGSVTEWWPDNSYEDYYGFINKLEFGVLKEGELPMTTMTVIKSNYDPVNKLIVAPVLVSVSGT